MAMSPRGGIMSDHFIVAVMGKDSQKSSLKNQRVSPPMNLFILSCLHITYF